MRRTHEQMKVVEEKLVMENLVMCAGLKKYAQSLNEIIELPLAHGLLLLETAASTQSHPRSD